MFSGKGRIARAVCPSMLTCMFLRFCALFSPIVLAARLVAIDLEDDLSYLSARQALQDGLPAVAAVACAPAPVPPAPPLVPPVEPPK